MKPRHPVESTQRGEAKKFLFTLARLRTLKPSKSAYLVWDEKLPGLTLRVSPGGTKAYYVVKRARGRQHKIAIEQFTETNPIDDVRKRASDVIAQFDKADQNASVETPIEARRRAVEEDRRRRLAETVSDIADLYERDHLPAMKARTLEHFRIVRRYFAPVLPEIPDPPKLPTLPDPDVAGADEVERVQRRISRLRADHAAEVARIQAQRDRMAEYLRTPLGREALRFGRLIATEVRGTHVRTLHKAIKESTAELGGRRIGGPYQANRAIACLSGAFGHALRCDLLPGPNPVSKVKRAPEHKRKVRFYDDELKRLGGALDTFEKDERFQRQALYAVRLLALTGARRNEILSARWERLDTERALLEIPDHKASRKRGAKFLVLGKAALRVLDQYVPPRERPSSGLIFAGTKGILTGFGWTWIRMMSAAGIEGRRIHDLRKAFAGVATELGFSEAVIGELLGHAQVNVTQGYEIVGGPFLRGAADAIAGHIDLLLAGKKPKKSGTLLQFTAGGGAR